MKKSVVLPVLAVTLLAAGISEAAPRYPWPNERVETTETYEFTGGTLAGETILIETRYEIYDLLDDGAYMQDDPLFYAWQGGCPPVEASITSAGLTPTGQDCSFLKYSDEGMETLELYFDFDPAANTNGIFLIAQWNQAIDVFFDDGTDELCQPSGADAICTRSFEQTVTPIAPVPLPAPALLLVGALGGLGLMRRRAQVATGGEAG